MELDLQFKFDVNSSKIYFFSNIREDNNEPTQYYFLEKIRNYVGPRITKMPAIYSYQIIVEPPKRGRELQSRIVIFKEDKSKKLGIFEKKIIANIDINKNPDELIFLTTIQSTPVVPKQYIKLIKRIIDFHKQCFDINLDCSRQFIAQEAQIRYVFNENYKSRQKIIDEFNRKTTGTILRKDIENIDIVSYMMSGLKR